ncbi:MAG: GDP-mannose 4,6-dehydratase [Candidatus Omnitrophica bacterium]|nr:GDP-mannose 4,6-dehydratase [Candidatus Omnitrophota bacterium]
MKTGLITGITGQDGSYLAELLLAQGYRVVGAVRDVQGASKVFSSLPIKGVELVKWDMLNQAEMVKVLSHYQPVELYNFAAYSSGEGMFDDPVGIGEVNGLAVARILEAIRQVNKNIRFCQASSSEMFGDVIQSPQSEETVFHPRSPYGAAKLYAHSLVQIYRRHYGLFACSAILFNHESPRRGFGFVTRKITSGAAKIKLGLVNELCLGSLDARRDWGFAGDYARAMWLMLQQPRPEDYVVATGETHSVRELCEIAFGHLGLDYRDYVHPDVAAHRLDESLQLVGNPEKARKQLGWAPEVEFREMIKMMVDADLRILIEQGQINQKE